LAARSTYARLLSLAALQGAALAQDGALDELAAALAALVAPEPGAVAPAPVPDREALQPAALEAEPADAVAAPVAVRRPVAADELRVALVVEAAPDALVTSSAAESDGRRALAHAEPPLHWVAASLARPGGSLELAREPVELRASLRGGLAVAPPPAVPAVLPEPDHVASAAERAVAPLVPVRRWGARREHARRARDTKWQAASRSLP
jgi:hypothetical protein